MTRPVGQRTLNRTLLERQLLLQRVRLPALGAIEHLVGLQAQAPRAPYVALWSRLVDFQPAELERLIRERAAVRALALLRTTIHLVSAADALGMRGVLQDVAERGFRSGSPFARQLGEIDLEAVIAVGRQALERQPLTVVQLAKVLATDWPDKDPTALAMAVRYLVPLVQPPPRGLWTENSRPTMVPLDQWLGRPIPTAPAPDELVLRYLRAFGPATVADIAAWSWLTGVREIVDRLRPRLRVVRDDAGRDLFDVEDGQLVDADVPAPPRFLPEYDNVLLSHADRSRIWPAGWQMPLAPGDGARLGTLLVDGFAAGTWRISLGGEREAPASLTIEPIAALGDADEEAVASEARALATFLAPGRLVDLRFEPPSVPAG